MLETIIALSMINVCLVLLLGCAIGIMYFQKQVIKSSEKGEELSNQLIKSYAKSEQHDRKIIDLHRECLTLLYKMNDGLSECLKEAFHAATNSYWPSGDQLVKWVKTIDAYTRSRDDIDKRRKNHE
jgi:hypothetical protein